MSTAPAVPPGAPRTVRRVLRSLVLPAACGALAVIIAAAVDHILAGLFIAAGLALGTVNGLLAEIATARLALADGASRGMVIGSSLRRLGAITAIAAIIAWLARPDGWTIFIGLAFYQLLTLSVALGAAAREARRG